MLFLEMEDPDADIMLYINSPGGSVSAGMAIYDTMQLSKVRGLHAVRGHGGLYGRVPAGRRREGQAQGAAQRRDHDPSAAAAARSGQATDIQIQADQILKIKKTMNELLAQNTGKPLEDHRTGRRARPLPQRGRGAGITA